MATQNNELGKTYKVLWWFAFVFMYLFAAVSIVGLVDTPDKLSNMIYEERVHNASILGEFDKKAWEESNKNPITLKMVVPLIEHLENSQTIVPNKDGVVENVWKNTPENLMLYSRLIDYRLIVFLYLTPFFLLFWSPFVIDAFFIRKVAKYKNSFSSPLRHTIGGKLLMIPSTVLLVSLLFAPIEIPVEIICALVVIKSIGWWLWISNLPKRL